MVAVGLVVDDARRPFVRETARSITDKNHAIFVLGSRASLPRPLQNRVDQIIDLRYAVTLLPRINLAGTPISSFIAPSV
jgi:hypothetical protein